MRSESPSLGTRRCPIEAGVLASSIGLLLFVSTYARPSGEDTERLSTWTPGGKPVCVATGDQVGPVTVADGAGGFFTVWQDAGAPQPQIYVQRLDSQGDPMAGWLSDGLPIAPSSGFQMSPAITSDGSGGLLVGWVDTSPGLPQIFVQRVTSSGNPHPGWPATGLRVSPTTAGQSVPVLATDGAGGAFVAFQDLRSGSFNQIFVQRVQGDGSIAPGWPGMPPMAEISRTL